jgi:hypothetical protein
MAADARGRTQAVTDKLKDHPVVVLIGTISAVLGITVPITGNLYDTRLEKQKLQSDREVAGLKQSLSSIQRAVGGEVDYLDVSKIPVTQADAAGLPQGSRFFEEGYFAVDPAGSSPWKQGVTTELQLYQDLAGANAAKALANQAPILRRFPVRLWRRNDPHVIRVPASGESITVYPQVFVEQTPLSRFARVLPAELGHSVQDDPAGVALFSQLQLQLPLQEATRASIVSIQKKANVGYARYESRFDNALVDGSTRRQYFLTQEIVVVATGRDLF